MDAFDYREGQLWCEKVPAQTLAAQYGTPAYVYSRRTFVQHFETLRAAFAELDPLICFALKSCQNLHICRLLCAHGSGFDVVSGGELFRALQAGADPAKIVYAGVGKTAREIGEALDAGIALFNIESAAEAEEIVAAARLRGTTAQALLRLNPDVDAKSHDYTTTGTRQTKFGLPAAEVVALFRRHADEARLRLRGLHLHVGSPVLDTAVYARSIERALALVDALRGEGFTLDTLDIGGGFGAPYTDVAAPTPAEYARVIVPLLRNRGLRVIVEPGRSIAANAGILLTRVLRVKESDAQRFVIVDAAMNDLIRPALYGAFHFVWPVNAGPHQPRSRAARQPFPGLVRSDVVGPICETGDFLARGRELPPLRPGDLLAVFGAGAYGMVMASQYNSRPRAPEILVDGHTARLIRRRETYVDLAAAELVEDAPMTG